MREPHTPLQEDPGAVVRSGARHFYCMAGLYHRKSVLA
jgi:hypothetical protein